MPWGGRSGRQGAVSLSPRLHFGIAARRAKPHCGWGGAILGGGVSVFYELHLHSQGLRPRLGRLSNVL